MNAEARDWNRTEVVAHQILLIEDEPDQAATTKEILETHGFRVQIAKDGGQAQATFVMWKPDLVLLDVILPGESGFEVCERLKKTDKNVPVIMVTAIDLEDSRTLAERVGADSYITKPFSAEQLVKAIVSVSEQAWERVHQDHPREEGRVRFSCRCGKRFKVSVAHRGKAMTCPECGEPVIVPRHD
ncbi:MAG: response regulator [Planctomycetaceae bacterium]|nr:response regulator [Planctomycetaceae bacterium]